MFLFIAANIGISAQNTNISKFESICHQKQGELWKLGEEECIVPDFVEIGDIMEIDVEIIGKDNYQGENLAFTVDVELSKSEGKYKTINPFLYSLFDMFPNFFPILRFILKL